MCATDREVMEADEAVAIEGIGGTTAFVVDAVDDPIDGRRFRELVMEAHAAGVSMLVVPVDALDPAFFDLRSGLAGDILQASVTYAMPLAVVGALPEPAASSSAFAALVRESNRGRQHRFAESIAELRAALTAG